MTKSAIVIGAGAAGLSGAAVLARAGIQVAILEGRNRIGGRIFTQHLPGLSAPVELGAEFIHGKAPQIFKPMKVVGEEIIESIGGDSCKEEGELCACEFFEKVEALLEKMKDYGSPDRSFSTFLRQLPRERDDENIRWRALEYVSGFNAADAEKISVRSLIKDMERSQQIGGNHTFRLRNGYPALLSWLQTECTRNHVEMRTDHAVTQIKYDSDRAVVSGNHFEENFQIEADVVVVTVPVPLLVPGKTASITFDPELPQTKVDALRSTAFGPVMRVVLVFKEPFWKGMKGKDGRSLSKLRFLFSHDPYFPTWWTQHPVEAPMLVAWSAGPRAEQFRGWTKQRTVEQALSSLAGILSVSRGEFEGMLQHASLHDWQADPFSQGAYSYLCVGAADSASELARPIDNNVFFAGEATDMIGDHGTVHGAIASGERAAREILES
jgi:monoamine oxidase